MKLPLKHPNSYALRFLRTKLATPSSGSLDERALLVFINYVGIKQHFRLRKFIWNLNNRSLNNFDLMTLNQRNDSKLFYQIADKKHLWDFQQEMISFMIYNNGKHISEALHPTDEMWDYHKLRMSNLTQLHKKIKEELDTIHQHTIKYSTYIEPFFKPQGDVPKPGLINLAIEREISLETLCAVDLFLDYTRFGSNDPLWEINRLRIAKYKLLLNLRLNELEPYIANIINSLNK